MRTRYPRWKLSRYPLSIYKGLPYHLHMQKKYELQEMALGALFAQSLEMEAARMPPEQKMEALVLRRQAEYYKSLYTKIIRVWREVSVKVEDLELSRHEPQHKRVSPGDSAISERTFSANPSVFF